LAAQGIEVPGAVSLAGFDDIAIAAMTAPALSTVRLPLRELGRLGYVHAGRVLEGVEPAHEVLPTELVLRRSTGRPAAVALPDARRTDSRVAS
jgi:LacI family transcriptional regulator